MSQAHVTDFFSTRKRTNGGNPSKRRKLVGSVTSDSAFNVQSTNTISEKSSNNLSASGGADTRPENSLQTLASGKCVSSSKQGKTIRKKTTKTKTVPNQPLLKDIISSSTADKDDYRMALPLSEEITSAWDEHDGPLMTPSKKSKQQNESMISEGSRKRTRCGVRKEVDVVETPLKDLGNPLALAESENVKARKQLDLNKDEKTKEKEKSETSNVDIPMSPRLKKTIEKVKQLGSLEKKMAADQVKQKLQKCGRLEEIKAQLSQMNKKITELKKPLPKLEKFDTVIIEQPVKQEETPKPMSPVKQTAPAYERFHSLATPAPPTLSLPYRYKLLAEMFRNCDTVVSMLHNRAEVCTFSKLKAAVQDMSKRNFEEKNLGQIKTVEPDAYILRQEKGLSAFGKKTTGYQLTVDANLNQGDEKDAQSYKTRQTFTAKHLLERRSVFSNKLISIVKRHHKEFLLSLDRPLNVPDDKITRWHPKFRLDEVPDIEPSELPKSPNVQVYQTAKDVLENARGKVLPNVEQALQNVCAQKTEPVATVTQSKEQPAEVKGIPQSLLEKIRAKEAAKMEAAMMRDPKEDKRQKMLQRLPEMMRILRAHFVTEKKPALLRTDIVQKLADSCRSSIGMGDVESHVNLMVEMLPQWLKQVEIKKGKYIKMDRNIELQTLIATVNKSTNS